MKKIITCLFIIFLSTTSLAAILHVPSEYTNIQAGIDAAVDGDTVVVADGTYTGTGNRDIDFLGKIITVTSENGPETCVIDCEQAGRAVIFQSGETASSMFSGFAIRNGFVDGRGGAVAIDHATATISDCKFVSCSAEISGGAVYIGDGGSGEILSCTFEGNTARFNGAVYVNRWCFDITITNSVFTGNSAETGAGAVYTGGRTSTISGCTFTNNRTYTESNNGIDVLTGAGGALAVVDGTNTLECSIDNCTFQGNSANWGGGIHNSAQTSITGCTFLENQAGTCGGAIFIDSAEMGESEVVIGGDAGNGNIFHDNRAGCGSDLFSFGDVSDPINATYNQFSGHFGSNYYVHPIPDFSLTGSTTGTNPVNQDLFVSENGNDTNNGLTWDTAFRSVTHALQVASGTAENPIIIHIGAGTFSPTVSNESYPLQMLDYITISGEEMNTTILDAEMTERVVFAYEDSGVYLQKLTVTQGTGGLLKYNSYAGAGGIYCYRSSPEISHCRITHNSTEDLEYNSVYGAMGGGILLENDSNAVITLCLIDYNTAESLYNNSSRPNGAGICTIDSGPIITDCDIKFNTASGSGGGIGCDRNLYLDNVPEVSACNIAFNTAGTDGGGICVSYAFCNVSDCSFVENTAGNHAGGFFDDSSGITNNVTGCTFSGNRADSGGGIYQDSGPAIITGNTFTDNWAQYSGGALCAGATGVVIGGSQATANTFQGNVAGSGADLAGGSQNAQYNIFAGNVESDYYVTGSFDLSHSVSNTTLINRDFYVKPDGNDTLDGSDWTNACRTLQHAMSLIQGTESTPVTVFLAAGTYSPSVTGEIFPIPAVNFVSIKGAGSDQTIIDAEQTAGCFVGAGERRVDFSGMTITGGEATIGGGICLSTQPDNWVIDDCVFTTNQAISGGAAYLGGEPLFQNCRFTGNSAVNGGGIYSFSSDTHFRSCEFRDNSAENEGGGVWATNGPLDFTNCIFYGNSAIEGGGLYHWNYNGPHLYNCLFFQNSASEIGGGISAYSLILENCTLSNNNAESGGGVYAKWDPYAGFHTQNSIFWLNAPDQFVSDEQAYIDITFSNIMGGYTGEGNIDADPIFVTGPDGDFYLSHTAAGQGADSPCIDTGSGPAADLCYEMPLALTCMDELTTRTDEWEDSGTVDMGFHYFPADYVTPTPTVPPLGVDLILSEDTFQPGDTFTLTAFVSNPGPEIYSEIPLVVLLDVYGNYFWHPTWTQPFNFESLELMIGTEDLILLDFIWPETGTSASGIRFYAAFLNESFTAIQGNWDMITFGWEL